MQGYFAVVIHVGTITRVCVDRVGPWVLDCGEEKKVKRKYTPSPCMNDCSRIIDLQLRPKKTTISIG